MVADATTLLLAVIENKPDVIQKFLDEGGDPSENFSALLRNAASLKRTEIVAMLIPKCPSEDIDAIVKDTLFYYPTFMTMQLISFCSPQTRVDVLLHANSAPAPCAQSAHDLLDCLLPLIPFEDISMADIPSGSYVHQMLSQAQHNALTDATSDQLSNAPSTIKPKI